MKRLLSLILVLLMTLSLLPLSALATAEEPVEEAAIEETVEDVTEETTEETAEETAEGTTEETAEAEETTESEEQAVSLDGDTAGFEAVTGDAVTENGVVTIYGNFTKPATEAAYGCYLRYSTDVENHYSGFGPNYGEALFNEEVSWTLDWESYAEILPGVTYYYYAVIEDAEDHDVVTGEVKSFVGPTDNVKTIQTGQKKTVAAGTTAYYSFTPTADGVYTLDYDGAGEVRVYVSTGDVLTLDYLSEEEVGIYAGLASYVASAGQTYYIEAQSWGSTSLSFELRKEAALTDFKAVTGSAKIDGSSVTISGTFTKPFTTSMCTAKIYVALSEDELTAEGIAASGYICDGVDSWSNKSGSADVAEWSLLVPDVTYYYRAVITGYTYAGETIVAGGDIKTFVAPNRSFETLIEDQEKTILAGSLAQYCSFTPANDGTYDLRITDGEGMISVYDFSGKQITMGHRSQDYEYNYETDELEEVYYDYPATFTAEAGKTYYIVAYCWDGSMSLLATNITPAHVWDDGAVTTEPTCTEKGVKTYTCSECGETKTEEIAATGHDWDDGKVTKEASLSETGETTYTCSVCGETKTESNPRLTAADVLESIDENASPDDIRDAVQEIGADALTEALTGEQGDEILEKLEALEDAVGDSVTVVVTDEAKNSGVSGAAIVGALLNDLAADNADNTVTLTIAAADTIALPEEFSAEGAVYLDITLEGVANPHELAVPVVLTVAVPDGLDTALLRVVHYKENADGEVAETEILKPTVFRGEDGQRYARFVVTGFSTFALAQLAHIPGDMDGDGEVTILDVLALLKSVAGITDELPYGDVNGDDAVTILDVLYLLKYVAGIITEL